MDICVMHTASISRHCVETLQGLIVDEKNYTIPF